MVANGFEDFWYSASDGLKLHARIYGEATGRLPAICLPGLTRNAADFHELALHLSRHEQRPRQVIAFDYRGRGRSAYDPDWHNYNVVTEAGDVLAGLTALGIAHGGFIGTSRGGLIAMVLAAMRPAALKAVVLNDVGPVVDGAGLAQIRSYLERAPSPKSIADAIAVQRAANGQSFSALGEADWERLVKGIFREENGRLIADYDPALLNTLKAIDLSKPLPTLWPQFMGLAQIPVMVIRGENSRLLSAESLREMQKRMPALEAHTVEGQGHAPLLETGRLPELIAAFLERAEARR
jgi:pimeloyl-ACP methyl ester carboxylesterase